MKLFDMGLQPDPGVCCTTKYKGSVITKCNETLMELSLCVYFCAKHNIFIKPYILVINVIFSNKSSFKTLSQVVNKYVKCTDCFTIQTCIR